MQRLRGLLSAGAIALAGCGGASEPAEEAGPVAVRIDRQNLHFEVSARFLSFALDTAQVTGARWWTPGAGSSRGRGVERVPPFDFERPRLAEAVRALAPAYLRIGGSEADFTHYALDDAGPHHDDAPESVLTWAMWERLNAFAARTGLEVVFALNAGPSERDDEGRWTGESARRLIERSAASDHPVSVWELGNELNGFWAIHGLRAQIRAPQYMRDLARLDALLREHAPGARYSGPASAFWPALGEVRLPFFGLSFEMLAMEEVADLPIFSWHFYPTQSERCPIRTRPATLERMLDLETWDEVRRWSRRLFAGVSARSATMELWMGETGPAQCGGQAGLSDRFASTLWWLDHLGSLASTGNRVVVRQTLVGSEYGLLQTGTLHPNPDYWSSLLWKRLMGERVLRVEAAPAARVYAHCTAGRSGAVSVLAINPSRDGDLELDFTGPSLGEVSESFYLTATDPLSPDLRVNGQRPDLTRLSEGAAWRRLAVQESGPRRSLPPVSAAWFVFGAARAPVCL